MKWEEVKKGIHVLATTPILEGFKEGIIKSVDRKNKSAEISINTIREFYVTYFWGCTDRETFNGEIYLDIDKKYATKSLLEEYYKKEEIK